MASISTKRLAKELTGLQEGCPAGITLLSADDLKTWILSIEVLGESVYKVCSTRSLNNILVYGYYQHVRPQGEVFALRFTFGPRYR